MKSSKTPCYLSTHDLLYPVSLWPTFSFPTITHLKNKKVLLLHLFVCTCVYACGHACATVYVCKSEDNFWVLVLFLYHVSLRYKFRSHCLGKSTFNPLNHITGPEITCFKINLRIVRILKVAISQMFLPVFRTLKKNDILLSNPIHSSQFNLQFLTLGMMNKGPSMLTSLKLSCNTPQTRQPYFLFYPGANPVITTSTKVESLRPANAELA